MPDVRYVCLSDLHFGAENSLLTNVVDNEAGLPTTDATQASACLRAFVDCLAALVDGNEDRTRKPQVVLNGDILEFALASDNEAVMAFERFIELAFAPGDAVFDRTVVYVPGNHDHHLWETARELQYASYVRDRNIGLPLEIPWHSTELYAPERRERLVESELLRSVVHRLAAAGRIEPDVRIEVHYPNFGLLSDDGRRAAVFHHGHFIESMYLLMSRLKKIVFPAHQSPLTPWDLEAENFAWIDFFWSALGRSGEVGTDVGLVYDMLRSAEAQRAMADNLAAAGAEAIPRVPTFLHAAPRWALRKALEVFVLRNVKRLERSHARAGVLTDRGRHGLREYVEGPLAVQLAREGPDNRVPDELTFVFGHTHKPFEARQAFDGYSSPATLYNSGGWVVDDLAPEVRQGAAAVLLDEDLRTVSLRLFNQQTDPAAYRVDVRAADGGDADSPFAARLQGVVDADSPPWSTFSKVVAEAVPERCEALGRIIEDGVRQLRGLPAARRLSAP